MFERQRQTDAVWNVYTTMSLSLKVRAITFFVCLCVHNLKVQVFSGTIAAPEMPIFFLLSSEKKKKKTYIKENAQIQREHEKNAFENYRHASLSDMRRQKSSIDEHNTGNLKLKECQ